MFLHLRCAPAVLAMLVTAAQSQTGTAAHAFVPRYADCAAVTINPTQYPSGVHAAVRYRLLAEGRPASWELQRSTGNADLDRDILNSLRSCAQVQEPKAGSSAQADQSLSVFVSPEGELYAGDRPKLLNARQWSPSTNDYPVASLRDREQGLTKVRFTLDEDGTLVASEIAKSSGYHRLDARSIHLIKQCRFAPGRTVDGKGIGGSFVVDYRWKLD
jgi:TonB family protein